MNARDQLNLMHLADEVIVTGTEMMSTDNPSFMDLQMVALDLETAARKIRLYAGLAKQGERGW